MATFSATTVVIATASRTPPRAQLRVARAEAFRCTYSKEGLKACSAMNLSPAVLKGMGLRWSWRPWGPELVEERLDAEKEDTRLGRSSSAELAQLRAARNETLRRGHGYSKENRKALSALNLSPAVLKGMGLRWSWRPWGSELVEERMDTGGGGHDARAVVNGSEPGVDPRVCAGPSSSTTKR
jgi:hypothetical protein